jgi:hypothetical protein
MTALTVVAHFSFTRSVCTFFTWMAHLLASMRTVFSWLHASLSASFFHQFFNSVEASSFGMANLLTNMSTSHWESTRLSAIRISCVAVFFFKTFLSAYTSLLNRLQTGWASTQMAFEGAHMSALQFLLARTLASWLNLTTLDWWIKLCNTAWAK